MTDNNEQSTQELLLGDAFYYGNDNTEIDKEKAFEHYLTSAKLGNMKAAYNVSDMYEDGDGVEKNDEESLKWLIESANKNNTTAQYDLAVHYYNNNELENSLIWFYNAHINGDKKARIEIKDILNDYPELIVGILIQNQELKSKIKKIDKKLNKLV
jgi:TPR repeat protein